MATATSDKPPSGGFSSYIPLILAILLMPLVAYLTLKYLPGIKAARSQSPTGGGGTNQTIANATNQVKALKKRAHSRMPVPLADGYLGFAPEVPNDPGPSRLMLTNAPQTLDFKFVLRLADTKRPRYALLEMFMVAEDTDLLIARANSHHIKLFMSSTNVIGRKTAETLLKPGARNILRTELLTVFNEVLGSNSVSEILIPTFLVQ